VANRSGAGDLDVIIYSARKWARLALAGNPTVLLGAETRLTELRDSAAVPDQPDRAWVDDWLHRSYLNYWEVRAARPTGIR
jgi:RNA repair pathway DNA polymerase beta family